MLNLNSKDLDKCEEQPESNKKKLDNTELHT